MDKTLKKRAQRTYNWALRREVSRGLDPDLRRMLSDLRQRVGSLLDPSQNLNMTLEERERFLRDRIDECERFAEGWACGISPPDTPKGRGRHRPLLNGMQR